MDTKTGLERKFARGESVVTLEDGKTIAGYASWFGQEDTGRDIVEVGAYCDCLARMSAEGRRVKMLWQHDPAQVIGVWDEVREDARGLFVKGRLLPGVEKAREAAELIEAGALDGLSIGYTVKRAGKDEQGRRLLKELELWEVSLVTFPMLPSARVGAKADRSRELARAIEAARLELARD
ncbi:HK97 family phage prohead protease [Jannaschia donghaensis]|uniref:Phage prohead protease, HK97 family n=1 Tax=Jannaschia donghaensis TaxID=420998 RepID=A0A0M6YKM1_9RHOB|nr:HK97 family phage prohead protease [Jannaschia donghaensis]CTQ50912.1 phage prohead protease, HK97 family [Jannaschia donghaensis]